MTKDPINILLVDDQPAKLLSYEATLQSLGENLIKAGWVSSPRDLRAVRSKPNPVRPQPPRKQFRRGTDAGVRGVLRVWRVPEF